MLPFRPNYTSIGRSNPTRRAKGIASRQLVDRIIECAHRQVLDDPAAQQRILFKQLAHAMGLDSETVANAFMDGGGNGISFNVTEEDRDTIRRLVASKPT